MSATVRREGREEITLRLGDDAPEPVAPPAPVESAPAVRESEASDELHVLASLIRANGGHPEKLLRLELARMTRRWKKDAPRLKAALDRERAIRERAAELKSRKVARVEDAKAHAGEPEATHRQRLRRLCELVVAVGYVHDPERRSPLWAAMDAAEKEAEQGLRQTKVTRGNVPRDAATEAELAPEGNANESPRTAGGHDMKEKHR
jgi:hypothetical protein